MTINLFIAIFIIVTTSLLESGNAWLNHLCFTRNLANYERSLSNEHSYTKSYAFMNPYGNQHTTTFMTNINEHEEDDFVHNKNSTDSSLESEIRNFLSIDNDDGECYDLCDWDTEIESHKQNSNESNRFSNVAAPSSSPEIDDSIFPLENNENETHRTRKILDLQWNINSASDDCHLDDILSCSEPCDACRGTGRTICSFCKGVGYIDFGEQVKGTIGERLVKNNGGVTGVECPVCDDNGEEVCKKCNGSGWIARWRLKSDNSGDVENLYP